MASLIQSFRRLFARTSPAPRIIVKRSYEGAQTDRLNQSWQVGNLPADLAASFRGALEILPDRLSPELVPLSDTEAVRAVLVEAFEATLTDISDKIKKWGAD